MTNMNIQVLTNPISDSEAESMINSLARESIEIINQELDYFFSNKETLAEFFVESLRTDEINPGIAKEFFQKCYAPGELKSLILRIEGQIRRQIGLAQGVQNLSLLRAEESVLSDPDPLILVREEIRTLKLNQAVVKAIDLVWTSTCKEILPKGLSKLTSRFKPGQHILASIGIDPREIRESIKIKLTKRLKGALRQNKTELLNLLTKEVIKQVFTQKHSGNVYIGEIKTA